MVYADASLGGCTTLACFQALDLSTLLSVQTYVNVVAPYLRNSIPTGESGYDRLASL
jgi:hypothetical protein